MEAAFSKFLEQLPVWINPLWILLGAALGLHGLSKAMSRGTIALYIFASLVLAGLSLRAGLRQSRIRQEQRVVRGKLEEAHEAFEQQQLKQEREFGARQNAFNLQQQAFSEKQSKMASDLRRLADLEKKQNATATLTARLINTSEPDVQIANSSDVEARNVFWQVVLWNLDVPSNQPYRIPSQVAAFVKPHTAPLPFNLFAGRGIRPRTGDRIFGYLVVDCSNCGAMESYWVFFRFARGGWFAPVPPGHIIDLNFLSAHLKSFREEHDDRWLDKLALAGTLRRFGRSTILIIQLVHSEAL